jgi:AcrR family transcriptional regulator
LRLTEHDPSAPDTPKAERILQAAEALLAEGGHASLTVANIVRRAGVSRGLLHYYFDSMEDILLRIIQRQARESLERAAGFVEGARSRQEVIDTFVAAFAQVLTTRPELYAVYYEAYVQSRVHDSVRAQLAEVYQSRRDALAKGLLAAEEQGLVHLPHGADAVASIVVAVAQGIALQHLSDPEMPEHDVWAVVRTMFDRLLDRPAD